MIELTKEKYDLVPDYIKENLVSAVTWASLTLTNYEGDGHNINVIGNDKGQVCCCFDKSEWKADHCGDYMDTASEAVVIAVCGYLAEGELYL